MKMTIGDAVQKLQKEARISDFTTFLKEVTSMTGTKLNSSRLENEIQKFFLQNMESIRSIKNPEKIIYRSEIAKNAKVVVKLTEEERKQKRLYLGHRLLPFLNPLHINNPELKFKDEEGNDLATEFAALAPEEVMKYILFLDLYILNNTQTKNHISLQYVDLNSVKCEEYLEIEILDYHNKKIKIKRLPNSTYLQHYFINSNKDQQLLKGITEVVNSDPHIISIDHTLMNVYYHLASQIATDPGSPLASIFNEQNEIVVHVGHDITFFTTKEKQQMFLDESLNDLEMGKAKDMEGILREMGISFNTDFLLLTMISDIFTRDMIDDDYILDELLETELRLYNEQQAENLDKAYNKLRKKAIRDFPKFDRSSVSINYLNTLLDIEEDMLFLIRDFDMNDDIDYDKKMEILIPILDIDRFISHLMGNYVKNKTATATELQELKRLYTTLDEAIDSITEILDYV